MYNHKPSLIPTIAVLIASVILIGMILLVTGCDEAQDMADSMIQPTLAPVDSNEGYERFKFYKDKDSPVYTPPILDSREPCYEFDEDLYRIDYGNYSMPKESPSKYRVGEFFPIGSSEEEATHVRIRTTYGDGSVTHEWAALRDYCIEPVVEVSEDFQPSWDWVDDNIFIAEKYRRFISIPHGAEFGPGVTFTHYRDADTFTDVGSESLLSVSHHQQGYLLPDLSGWDLPWYTVISYDPNKIEILTESEMPPPEFITRVGGWLSDTHFTQVRGGNGYELIRETPDSKEAGEMFDKAILENISTGEAVQIKRDHAARVRIKYRYLGGGDAYIFIWSNVPHPQGSVVVGIKVTSEDL